MKANDRPMFVRLAFEAERRGLPTKTLRKLCKSNGVPLRRLEDSRIEWVSPAALDAAIGAAPIVNDTAAANDNAVADIVTSLARKAAAQ